jgi:uncharacterized membrane protein YagU involved in acid resistance
MKKTALLKSILIAWLIAGTLDITGAIIILSKGNIKGTLQYIASAVLGKNVSIDETGILFFGAGFHYFIALCWTVFYFLVYKIVKFNRLHIVISSLLYGTFIYFSMRYVFVPLFGQLPPPKTITSSQISVIIKNILILAVAFGVTLNIFAAKYYKQRR